MGMTTANKTPHRFLHDTPFSGCAKCGLPSNHSIHDNFVIPQIEVFTSASSSKKPRFDLIPYPCLVALANVFELGLERHKELAWNALSPNVKTALDDDAWVRSRISHIISHAYSYLREREGLIDLEEYDKNKEDDGAAIMFGGCVLVEALRRREEVIKDKLAREKEETRKRGMEPKGE